jgi:nucleoside-diphosphate-sugar epimerase
VHTASPVEFDPDHFEEKHLNPAVQGTRGVLEAAANEESVKSVVMTSTYGTLFAEPAAHF